MLFYSSCNKFNQLIFADGLGAGVMDTNGWGTGGSYGGEGGAYSFVDSPSKAYGSLLTPNTFGSVGGNDSSNYPGTILSHTICTWYCCMEI